MKNTHRFISKTTAANRQMNTHKTISKLTIYLVAVLALGALVLSYDNLVGVASENGITGWKSWLWPLLLDFALIVFSLAVVRNSLLGERTRWPWAMVGIFTAGTLGFNILHADTTMTARIMAAVAPAALFLSFETLMSQMKSEVKRQSAINSLEEMSTDLEMVTGERDTVTDEVSKLIHRRNNLTDDMDTMTAEMSKLSGHRDKLLSELSAIRDTDMDTKALPAVTNAQMSLSQVDSLDIANDTKRTKHQERLDTTQELLSQGLDISDIADTLEVTERTVRRYLSAIENGNDDTAVDRIIAAADENDREDIADIAEAIRDGLNRVNGKGGGK